MTMHQKHLQLGVDPENIEGDNRDYLGAEGPEADALWADATTVERFKEDIELLASLAKSNG